MITLGLRLRSTFCAAPVASASILLSAGQRLFVNLRLLQPAVEHLSAKPLIQCVGIQQKTVLLALESRKLVLHLALVSALQRPVSSLRLMPHVSLSTTFHHS